MFLLLLFIRLFERQRNGRVAKLPLRTFFAFAVAVAVAVAVTARAYFTLFDVLLWACVSVCVCACSALPCRTLLHFTTAHRGGGGAKWQVSTPSHTRCRVLSLSLSLAPLIRLTTSRSRLALLVVIVFDLSRDFSLLFYNGVAINTHASELLTGSRFL